MELDELDTHTAHTEGAECRIFNALTGKQTDIYIRVLGIDSDQYRKSAAKARELFVASKMTNGEVKVDADLLELDTLVDVTVGWRGITNDGKEWKFNKSRCKKLYKMAPYIRDQIDRFLAKRVNFIKG
jgi:hypothetical protein